MFKISKADCFMSGNLIYNPADKEMGIEAHLTNGHWMVWGIEALPSANTNSLAKTLGAMAHNIVGKAVKMDPYSLAKQAWQFQNGKLLLGDNAGHPPWAQVVPSTPTFYRLISLTEFNGCYVPMSARDDKPATFSLPWVSVEVQYASDLCMHAKLHKYEESVGLLDDVAKDELAEGRRMVLADEYLLGLQYVTLASRLELDIFAPVILQDKGILASDAGSGLEFTPSALVRGHHIVGILMPTKV